MISVLVFREVFVTQTYIDDNCVACIRAASDTRTDVVIARKNVYKLPLPFIAPLGTNDDVNEALSGVGIIPLLVIMSKVPFFRALIQNLMEGVCIFDD